jgi:hypothetical protein
MSPAEFEPAIPASERWPTQALDRADSGIDIRKQSKQISTSTSHRRHTSPILWIRTRHATALDITPQIPNNVNSYDFNNYPFLAYICLFPGVTTHCGCIFTAR